MPRPSPAQERQRREAGLRRRAALGPDELALEADESDERSVTSLAAYLTGGWAGSGRELKQHRAIFSWLARRLTLLPHPSEAEGVVTRRRDQVAESRTPEEAGVLQRGGTVVREAATPATAASGDQ